MDHRTFISALVFLGKTGSWWIHLPQEFGKYKSIHARFTNWSRRGVFQAFLEAVRECGDLSVLRFVDASFVKYSICCLTGRTSEPQRVVGKTEGGFTTNCQQSGIPNNESTLAESILEMIAITELQT